eukprot:GHUV01020532.1.p1 GENE.GHUV01020532.1~~GHUV01020532.1.p1  ORF type:complete len:252 (+),score=36.01 GHUV01020532.1:724-1479(+)
MLECMDRTSDWAQAVDAACSRLDLEPADIKRHKQSLLLKSRPERSQFVTVAAGVTRAIHDLEDFIATNKRDYLSTGKLTEQAKDQIEEQVGVLVRTITQQLEALKNSVIAAQQPPDGSRPLINENTAAHLHGTVLVLVEQLHRVTSSFDKCRAVRYQQSLAKELRQHRKVQQQPTVSQHETNVCRFVTKERRTTIVCYPTISTTPHASASSLTMFGVCLLQREKKEEGFHIQSRICISRMYLHGQQCCLRL